MANKSAKVAISLPEDILEAVEMERKAKGENLSQFIQRVIERLLKKGLFSYLKRRYRSCYCSLPAGGGESGLPGGTVYFHGYD